MPIPELPPNVWRLTAARALRSFSQGYLNVVTPLYLISLGMSAAGLGLLFTASFLVGAVLTLATGFSADRIGRKPFLIAFTVLMFVRFLTRLVVAWSGRCLSSGSTSASTSVRPRSDRCSP